MSVSVSGWVGGYSTVKSQIWLENDIFIEVQIT